MDYFRFPLNKMDPEASGITVFNPRARPLFDSARQRHRLLGLIARICRCRRELLSMLDVVTTLPSTLPQCHRLQAVPIANIVGSVNRSSDFDKDFYPCNDVLENRWVRVASMILQGMSMPPVELIQVGSSYYVVDGHHRISVLHMLKMDIVDAIITAEYNTDISNG